MSEQLGRSIQFTLNGSRVTLNSSEVTAALNDVVPEPLRKHIVNIDGTWFPVMQAFEIATGVSRREFISHTARRHLAKLGFEVAGDIESRAGSATRTVAPPRPTAVPTTRARETSGRADLVLITCVKEKLDRPAAAKDLYTSPLFRKERAYAESAGVPWLILSAEHGLVAPDEWLAPYERYLPDAPATYRRAWGEWVAARLDLLSGGIDGLAIEVHAGATYVEAIRDPLTRLGASIIEPLAGLSFGERLAWYGDSPAGIGSEYQTGSLHNAAEDFCERLKVRADAVPPALFIERGSTGLTVPGLYSWWVDAEGARDLSAGLGHEVREGLVYAGLAGATRWPSGKRSTNTLWSRIAGMHLGKRHEFSTFRRTIGSILASADGREEIDEAALTTWMQGHLRVLAIPFDDADTLGHLEGDVLATLDPLLNLQGMSKTPLRTRLSELRRQYAG